MWKMVQAKTTFFHEFVHKKNEFFKFKKVFLKVFNAFERKSWIQTLLNNVKLDK